MATGDFDTYYSDNPWETIDKNQRTFYDPDLISLFRQRALFSPTIQFSRNLESARATSMVMTQLLDPHPDYTALAVRQIWMPASHIDSREITINFSRYGGKVAYMNYDDMVTYWRQNNVAGVRRIMRGALGQHMIDVLDLVARNAYVKGALDSGYLIYPSGVTNFAGITTSHLFQLATSMDIWLGMTYRNVAAALGPSGAAGSIICYTTPGVIYDIQKGTGSDEWISIQEYTGTRPLRYEVGTYKNIRFVQSPRLVLWNCGTIEAQGNVTVAVKAGDGALDPDTAKVDNTYGVGQAAASVVHSLTLGSFNTGTLADIDEHDIVTIHTSRTSTYGVSNGVNPFEGTAHTRRVVAKLTTPDRIVLDQPIMVDMDTDLGGGVYAYVTKGRHIHASVFVGGSEGIVAGVAQPPRFHAPPAVDDFESVQRFSWDAYMGYQTYAPEVFEVVLTAGTTRVKGAAEVQ